MRAGSGRGRRRCGRSRDQDAFPWPSWEVVTVLPVHISVSTALNTTGSGDTPLCCASLGTLEYLVCPLHPAHSSANSPFTEDASSGCTVSLSFPFFACWVSYVPHLRETPRHLSFSDLCPLAQHRLVPSTLSQVAGTIPFLLTDESYSAGSRPTFTHLKLAPHCLLTTPELHSKPLKLFTRGDPPCEPRWAKAGPGWDARRPLQEFSPTRPSVFTRGTSSSPEVPNPLPPPRHLQPARGDRFRTGTLGEHHTQVTGLTQDGVGPPALLG